MSVFATTGLDHDILLLHADSEETNEFASMLYRKLTKPNKPAYLVFHYRGDDVTPGTRKILQSFVIVMFAFGGHIMNDYLSVCCSCLSDHSED